MLVVEMAFESIAPAKLLSTTPDHHFPLPVIWRGIFWQVVSSRVFQGYTTADPLGRTPETRMGADMALEIGSAMVALDPLAVRTSPWIVLLGSSGDGARNGLNVARRGGRAGAFGWVWSTSYAGIFRCSESERRSRHGASGPASLSGIKGGRGDVLIIRRISVAFGIGLDVGQSN